MRYTIIQKHDTKKTPSRLKAHLFKLLMKFGVCFFSWLGVQVADESRRHCDKRISKIKTQKQGRKG